MKATEANAPASSALEQAKRDWLESIHPLVMQKASIIGLGGMRVAVNADGTVADSEYIITDEQRELLAQIDELIESMKPAILRNQPD